MAICPECDAEIEVEEDDFEEMEIGDPWDCDSCGSRLRIVSLDPLEFDGDDEDEDDDEAEGEVEGETDGDDDDDDDDEEEEAEDWDE
jgi:lysine biosynthesis protein LysW